MMKTLISFLLFLPTATGAIAAPSFELTTLLGSANDRMPFVQEIVKDRVALAPGANFVDYTTGVLYFAWRNGVNSARTVQVLRDAGNANLADVLAGIELASKDSAVVLAPLSGDGVEEMCAKMAERTDTAFLITLGDVGYTLSPFFTKCASRNILFVTVLDGDLTGLGEYASYGPLVRLAVPGMDLSAPVDGDRRVSFLSDGFGMAIAAGQIAALSRSRPELRGAALLAEFLKQAEELPALRGKVTGAKAIRRFEK